MESDYAPGSGVSETQDETETRTAAVPSKEERLLQVHQTYRTEIVEQLKMTNRSNLRGVVAIAAIVGYAVSSGIEAVVGLIPVAMAYIFVKIASSSMWLTDLAVQIAEIERELSDEGSPIRWEMKRGAAVGRDYSGPKVVYGLKTFPSFVQAVIASSAYLGTIWYFLTIGWPARSEILTIGWLSRETVCYFYIVLSIFILSVWGVNRYYLSKAEMSSTN
jgi:hypothetical protein